MNMVILELVLRQLRYCEKALAGMDGPLAAQSFARVHQARLDVETMERLDSRKHSRHVLGERGWRR